MTFIRRIIVWQHRWTGLLMAGFLTAEAVQSLPTHPKPSPCLNWREAEQIGARFIAVKAAIRHFRVRHLQYLVYDGGHGMYIYRGTSTLNPTSDCGDTTVSFDGNTGALLRFGFPVSESSGNTFTEWMRALRMAKALGTPYRIFVFVPGFMISMLSVAGIWIWWKKRKGRLLSALQGQLIDSQSAGAFV